MSFHVDWTPRTREQMRDIWANAPEAVQRRLLGALADIAEVLTVRLAETGESRAGNARIAFFGAISIIFRVDVNRRRVRISHVHLIEQQGGSE